MSKDYGLVGVGSVVEFAKDGPSVDASSGIFEVKDSAGNLGLWRAKEAETGNDVVVLSQLDAQDVSLRQYVDASQLTIAADSVDLLNINGDNELSLRKLAVSNVYMDATSSDLDGFIASTSETVEEGDFVVLSTTAQVYIHNGGSSGTAADYTLINVPNLDAVAVRAMFSSGQATIYNPANGSVDIQVDDDTIDIFTDGNGQTRIRVKDGSLGASKLDLGTGAGQVNAEAIPTSSGDSIESKLTDIEDLASDAAQEAANATDALGIGESDTDLGAFGASVDDVLPAGMTAKAAIQTSTAYAKGIRADLDTEVNNLNTAISAETTARDAAIAAEAEARSDEIDIAIFNEASARENAISVLETAVANRTSALTASFSFSDLDANGRYMIGIMPAGSMGLMLRVVTPQGWGNATRFSVGSDVATELIADSDHIDGRDSGDHNVQNLPLPQVGGTDENIYVHVTGAPTAGTMKIAVEYAPLTA